MSVLQWLRRLLALYLSVAISLSELRWLLLRLVFYPSVGISMSGLRWLRQQMVLSVVSVLSAFGFLISQPPLRHVSVMAEVLYMVERTVDISLSGLRWLRRPSVLSVASVLSPFGFLIAQPPLRHVSVLAEVLYMVERTVDILLSGLRWLRRPLVLSVVSVLSPFEPRASQPPLLPASVMVCLLMFV